MFWNIELIFDISTARLSRNNYISGNHGLELEAGQDIWTERRCWAGRQNLNSEFCLSDIMVADMNKEQEQHNELEQKWGNYRLPCDIAVELNSSEQKLTLLQIMVNKS